VIPADVELGKPDMLAVQFPKVAVDIRIPKVAVDIRNFS